MPTAPGKKIYGITLVQKDVEEFRRLAIALGKPRSALSQWIQENMQNGILLMRGVEAQQKKGVPVDLAKIVDEVVMKAKQKKLF